MEFQHPLARGAKIWTARLDDGSTQTLLVVVTTVELDPKSKRYKPKIVERLSAAAQEFLASSKSAKGFVLINRLRDWQAARP
jgi:hypothetical protein